MLPSDFLHKIAENYKLTDREKEVFVKKFGSDKSDREIADELFLSSSAFRSRLSAIYRKFGYGSEKGPVKSLLLLRFLSKEYQKSHPGSISEASLSDPVIESQKIDRTLHYIQRWNGSHYSSFKKLGYQIHLSIVNKPSNKKGSIVIKQIEKDANLRMEVTELLNFLEEMALCVNREFIREDLSLNFYRSIVIQYCEIFGAWIAHLRNEKQNDKLYKELTNLFERWREIH